MSITGAIVVGISVCPLILILVIGEIVVTQVEHWAARLRMDCHGCGHPWTPSFNKIGRFLIVPVLGICGVFLCGIGKLRGQPIMRVAKLFAFVAFAHFVERRVKRGELPPVPSARLLSEICHELGVPPP